MWKAVLYTNKIYTLENCASLQQEHCLQLQTMRLQKITLVQSTIWFYSTLGSQMKAWVCGCTRKPSDKRKDVLESAWMWEEGIRLESEMVHMGWACEDAACVCVGCKGPLGLSWKLPGLWMTSWHVKDARKRVPGQICLSWEAVLWSISLKAITEFVVLMALHYPNKYWDRSKKGENGCSSVEPHRKLKKGGNVH